jgi:hypothetical protein
VCEVRLNWREDGGNTGWVALCLVPLAPLVYLAARVRWRDMKEQIPPDPWECRRCGRQWRTLVGHNRLPDV